MSANYKNTKGELIAIYRLEFYKKQKKWKLSHDERKKNNIKECVKDLNATYNIESKEPQPEPPAPLNEAFLVERSEKNTRPKNDQLKLPSPQAWPNQDLNLPELEAHEHRGLEADDRWTTLVEACHQRSYIEPIQQYDTEWWPTPAEGVNAGPPDPPPDEWTPAPYDLDPDYCWQPAGKATPWSIPEPYNPDEVCTCWGSRPLSAHEHAPLTGTKRKGSDIEDLPGGMMALWSGVNQDDHISAGVGIVLSSLLAAGVNITRAGECAEVLDGRRAVHGVLRAAEAWLRGEDATHLDPESPCWADVSVDSAWSFIRGAHSAPHSSELDLRPFTPCSCVVEASQLACMTAAQLSASLAQHAHVLRKLLRELHARTLDRQHAPYNSSANVSQEQPTRDTGPSSPQSPFSIADQFVAGSFMHAEVPGGRGRGRRLIGIGMGRPYRL